MQRMWSDHIFRILAGTLCVSNWAAQLRSADWIRSDLYGFSSCYLLVPSDPALDAGVQLRCPCADLRRSWLAFWCMQSQFPSYLFFWQSYVATKTVVAWRLCSLELIGSGSNLSSYLACQKG